MLDAWAEALPQKSIVFRGMPPSPTQAPANNMRLWHVGDVDDHGHTA
jgi:hypothetical protein